MIKAKDIIKSYGNGESRFQVLKGISLDIEDNDFVVILGASGSGKSTFLNVVSGLERPDSGKVSYDGKEITALSDKEVTAFRKENVGFIFQQYYLLPNMNVDKNVKMGADLADNKDYKTVIEAVGLGEKGRNIPANFQAANSREYPLQEPWQRDRKSYFLTNPQAHWTNRPGGRFSIISANFKRNMISRS